MNQRIILRYPVEDTTMMNLKTLHFFLNLLLIFSFVVSQNENETTTRILTIGDHLVIGSVPGGFRANVYYKLIDDGYNVDMLGTQTSNPYSNEMDPDHEGYSEKPILFFDDIDYFKNLRGAIATPDVIIVYAGTTDFQNEFELPMAVYRYSNLLQNLATIFPSSNIIASTLLGGYNNPYITNLFNKNLNDRVYELTRMDMKVTLADVASAVSQEQMVDDVYPTQEGYDNMAEIYVTAIESVTTPKGDYDEPVISDVFNPTSNRIRINFSKPLADDSNLDVSNFVLDFNIQVNSASLLATKRAIVLKTSDFSEYNSQQVPMKVTIIGGIKDLTGLTLAPNTSHIFLLGITNKGLATKFPTLPPSPLGQQTLPPAISSGLPESTTRILPLGDMLTIGGSHDGGYRNHLFDLLTAVKYNVEMVGTRTSNPGRMGLKHEGWSLKGIDWFLNLIPDLLENIPDPDVILLHLGMDDIIADESPGEDAVTAIYRYETLIMKIHELRPHVNIIATNLMRHELWQIDNKAQSLFNDEIRDRVESLAEEGVKISFLDMRYAVNPTMVTSSNNDELDLTDPLGYVQMANGWFGSILNIIGPHGDSSDPEIIRVKASASYNELDVTFSKPISDDSIDRRKFALEYNLVVQNVKLDDDKRTLTLTTNSFSYMEGKPLVLTIRNGAVYDRTPERRMVKAGTTYTFQVPLKPSSPNASPTKAPSTNSAPHVGIRPGSGNPGIGSGGKGGKGGKGKKKKGNKGGKGGKGKQARYNSNSSNNSNVSIPASPTPSPIAPSYRNSSNNNQPTYQYWSKGKGKKGSKKKKGKRLRS